MKQRKAQLHEWAKLIGTSSAEAAIDSIEDTDDATAAAENELALAIGQDGGGRIIC